MKLDRNKQVKAVSQIRDKLFSRISKEMFTCEPAEFEALIRAHKQLCRRTEDLCSAY